MADDRDDFEQVVQPEAKRPMTLGIAYLAFLFVIGLAVLLVAGGLIRL